MRKYTKALLFLSSYTPLLLIILIRDLQLDKTAAERTFFGKLPGLFGSPVFSLLILTIIIGCNSLLLWLLKACRRLQPNQIAVVKVSPHNSEVLNYMVTYIIPFLSFNVGDLRDLVSIAILVVVMAFVYANSSMVHINPMLSLFGRAIYLVDTDGDTVVLISNRPRSKQGACIRAVHLDDDIYVEV